MPAQSDDSIEHRVIINKFTLRKPNVLHYAHEGQHVDAIERIYGDRAEGLQTQRKRLDLFIDLIWVGVVSNISEHFHDQAFAPGASAGHATAEFVLLFLPAWRIWSTLQSFLSSFYKDDFYQQLLLLWVLLLGIVYGNNAPYLLQSSDNYDTSANSSYLLATYLLAVNALLVTQTIYSFWIPWLRRPVMIGYILSLPSIGLWIATMLSGHDIQLYLLIAAVVYDYAEYLIVRSPLGDKFVWTSGYRILHDPEYIRERYEGFFLIAIGEGVFLLIKSSPLGQGFTPSLSRGVLAFLIYYSLHWFYFNADQSRTFIHALQRGWSNIGLWQLLHVFMFGNIVQLSSGLLYLIDYEPQAAEALTNASSPNLARRAESISYDEATFRTASAYACINMGLIILSQTAIPLLDKSKDPPNVCLVGNRYLRLLPRACIGVIFLTLWLHDFPPTELLGISVLLCWTVLLAEWAMGSETTKYRPTSYSLPSTSEHA